MSTNNNSAGGIGGITLLSIVFIVLKLTHYIDWSWWYILLPLWGPLAILLLAILIMVLFVLIAKKRAKNN